MDAIASAAIPLIYEDPSTTPQNMTNLVWAFATLMIPNTPLFDAIASKSLRNLRSFNMQNISNTAWAFAKLGECDEELLAAIAEEALNRITEWSTQDCANLAWAFAKLGLRDDQLMQAISAAALPTCSEFSPQSLANLAWAYAMLGILDQPLLKAIAAASLPKLSDFSPHDLAYLAWAFAQLGLHDEPLLASLAAEVLRHINDFSVEDLAKTAWSWAVMGRDASRAIVHACCDRARQSPPVSTWNSAELLDTAHAFTWSAWTTARPDLSWAVFYAWASHGMAFDTATFSLLMMDSAYKKSAREELGIISAIHHSSAFEPLSGIFEWCAEELDASPSLAGAMRFDTRTCPGSGNARGTHAKLALCVLDIAASGAKDAASTLEAIRQHSYGEGQWLKVAGGGKANLIERSLGIWAAGPALVAVEFGVFVGYTTTRLGARAQEAAARSGGHRNALRVIGLEVEPVHVCVARWVLDIAALSGSVEVWAGIAADLECRIGDELGMRCVRLAFMDHRGTKFHEDLARIERFGLAAPSFRIVADNVLKPSAPAFLWMVNTGARWEATNWALGEFVQYYVEDWMVVADYLGPGCTATATPPLDCLRQIPDPDLPKPPPELSRLAWDSDKWRRRSEEGSVRISEWAAFAKHAREIFADCGIEARPWFN